MNCAELQRSLPDVLESGGSAAQREHLRNCSICSELVYELELISEQARLLRASEEPSPRVWNSIEIALRREGVIRSPVPAGAVGASFPWRLSPAWVLTAAAALLVSFAALRYQHQVTQQQQVAQRLTPAPSVPPAAAQPKGEDEQLLQVVNSRLPAMRATYESDLEDVNSYIRDAEASARSHPNDADEQEYLMDAYDQKAMVYELALDRSLP